MGDALVYTAAEVAGLLTCSTKHIYEQARLGAIPHRRLGVRLIFPKAAIDTWLAETFEPQDAA